MAPVATSHDPSTTGYRRSTDGLLTYEDFRVLEQAASLTRKPVWELVKSVEDSRSAPACHEHQQHALQHSTSPEPFKVSHVKRSIPGPPGLSEQMLCQSVDASFENRDIPGTSDQPKYISLSQELGSNEANLGSRCKLDKAGNFFANNETLLWEQLENSSRIMQTQDQFDTSIPFVSQLLTPWSNATAVTSNWVDWNSVAPDWEINTDFDYAVGQSVEASHDGFASTTSTSSLGDHRFGSYLANGAGLDVFQQTSQYSDGNDMARAPIIQGRAGLQSSPRMSEPRTLENIVSIEQIPCSPVPQEYVDLNSDTLPANCDQINLADISTARRARNKHRTQGIGKAPRSGVQKQIRRRARAPQQQYACWKCAFDHKQCYREQGLESCKRCAGFKSIHGSCFYTKVVEIYLFRTLTDPNVMRARLGIDQHVINRITRREIPTVKTIYITQGYGTVLPLKVQDFDASTINLQEVPVYERYLYTVPFQLVDLEESTKTMRNFVISSIKHYIKHRLRESDPITQGFFQLGLQAANDKSQNSGFIYRVLFLWTAARMMEGGWYFARGETLGLTSDGVEKLQFIDAPLIDYQFAGIMRDQILLQIRDAVLKELQDKIYKNHKKDSFAISIASFVLLNTYELLLRQQKDFALQRGARTRYLSRDLVHGIHHGAEVLLTHFHNCTRGLKMFDNVSGSQEEAEKAADSLELEHYQLEALRTLIPMIHRQVPRYMELVKTDDHDVDHWFTGQLFIRDWKASATMVSIN